VIMVTYHVAQALLVLSLTLTGVTDLQIRLKERGAFRRYQPSTNRALGAAESAARGR